MPSGRWPPATEFACFVATSLGFTYSFFQRAAPSSMASALQDEFSVDGTQLGSLSSAYFWPYLVIQFFLGWLFQRFGVELVMMVSMLVAGAGTIVFGVAGSLGVAVLGRCLIGLGVGAAWLGLVTVAQGKSFTQAGLSTTMVGSGLMFGLLGALIAQTPLTLAIQDAGFRPVLLWSALAPAAVAAVMAARLCSAQRGGGGGGAKSHLASVPPAESLGASGVASVRDVAGDKEQGLLTGPGRGAAVPSYGGAGVASHGATRTDDADATAAGDTASGAGAVADHASDDKQGVDSDTVVVPVAESGADEEITVWQAFGVALSEPVTLCACVYGFGVVGPLLAFASLWATPFLQDVYGLDKATSSGFVSAFLAGWGVGGPVLGAVVDRLGGGVTGAKWVMLVTPIAGGLALTPVLMLRLPDWLAVVLLVVAGACTVVPAVFTYVKDAVQDVRGRATAAALVNASMILAGASLQPAIGAILDGVAGDRVRQLPDGRRVYPEDAYHAALLLLPACHVMCLGAIAVGWCCLRNGRPAKA